MAQQPRELDPYESMRQYIGAELRTWRKLRGLSQRELAAQVPCDHSLISLAEGGIQLLSAQMLDRCDAILETGGALGRLRHWAEQEDNDSSPGASPDPEPEHSSTALSPRGVVPLGLTSAQEAEDDMKRRNLLRAIGAGAALSPAALEALSQVRGTVETSLTPVGNSRSLVDHWETTAARYGYGYQGRMPTEVLRDALLDLGEVQRMLKGQAGTSHRNSLLRVSAQLSGVAAIVLHDLGYDRDAHAWFGTAGAAASESGDRPMHAWILAREAMVPLNYGSPSGALDLSSSARHMAGDKPSAAAALAAAIQARAYASLGQAGEARGAMRDAEGMRDHLAAEQAADTWYGYPEQKHAVHASRVYTGIGDTDAANDAQREALRLSKRTSLMSPALIRLDKSACISHEGDHAAACADAVATVTSLPKQYRSGLVVKRAREVAAMLPEPARNLPSARELREVVAQVERPEVDAST